jgi:hypothetical protein
MFFFPPPISVSVSVDDGHWRTDHESTAFTWALSPPSWSHASGRQLAKREPLSLMASAAHALSSGRLLHFLYGFRSRCVCVWERDRLLGEHNLWVGPPPPTTSLVHHQGGGGMSCVAGDLILLVPFVWQVVTLLLSAARATWHGHLVTPNSVGGPPLGWWYIWFSHIPCQKGLIGSQSECLVEEWWRG